MGINITDVVRVDRNLTRWGQLQVQIVFSCTGANKFFHPWNPYKQNSNKPNSSGIKTFAYMLTFDSHHCYLCTNPLSMCRYNIALSKAKFRDDGLIVTDVTSRQWTRNRGTQIPRVCISINEEFALFAPRLRATDPTVSRSFEAVAARLRLRGQQHTDVRSPIYGRRLDRWRGGAMM